MNWLERPPATREQIRDEIHRQMNQCACELRNAILEIRLDNQASIRGRVTGIGSNEKREPALQLSVFDDVDSKDMNVSVWDIVAVLMPDGSNICSSCGSDLTSIASGICPECGTAQYELP